MGRAEELRHLRTLIAEGGQGAVVAGPAGVGKTRIGKEAVALASAAGMHGVRVSGTQTFASLPFGAFAAHLPAMAAGESPTETLRRVADAIVASGNGKRVAILVDDAHLLDESSAALTHHLASRDSTFVVATVRSTEHAPDAIVALWKEGLVERIDLATFSASEASGVLEAALGGPVAGSTARLLWAKTEGNALFLHELVLAAEEAGSLHKTRGVWHLKGSLPTSPRLVELLEARFEGLDEADRLLLDTLAIGEPIDLTVLERHSPRVDLDQFERRGVIRVEEDDRRLTVRLGHPLYGDVLRARLSPLRARNISRSLADAWEGVANGDTLRLATLRLAGGGAFDVALMTAGARQAHGRHDLPLAERLARAAWEVDRDFEAGLLAAVVVSQAGRTDDAEEIFASLVPAGDQARATLAASRSQNFLLARRADRALTCLEGAEKEIVDPVARAEITAQRIPLLSFAGRTAECFDIIDTRLPEATGRAEAILALAGSTLYGSAGQLAKALDLGDRALAAHKALDTPLLWPLALHRFSRIDTLSLMVDLHDVEEIAQRWNSEAVDQGAPLEEAYAAATLAKVLTRRGRVVTAAGHAERGTQLYREAGRASEQSYALVYLAHARALAGAHAMAVAALEEYAKLPVEGGGEFGAEVLQAHAWTAVAGDDTATGIDLLREASALAQRQRLWAVEAVMLHDLARLGRASDVAARLVELADVIEGPMIACRARHAAALVAADGGELDSVAMGLEDLGATLLAAEAAADAAVTWRRAGERRRATASERRAAEFAAECEGARTPALVTTVAARAELTGRELDVARLAAAGMSNNEIAARLFLSVRTVENKLHSTYAKLGVTGRRELAASLEQTR